MLIIIQQTICTQIIVPQVEITARWTRMTNLNSRKKHKGVIALEGVDINKEERCKVTFQWGEMHTRKKN